MRFVVCCRGSSSWPPSDCFVWWSTSLKAQFSAFDLQLIGSSWNTECDLASQSSEYTAFILINVSDFSNTTFAFHLHLAKLNHISFTLSHSLFCSISLKQFVHLSTVLLLSHPSPSPFFPFQVISLLYSLLVTIECINVHVICSMSTKYRLSEDIQLKPFSYFWIL